MIRSLRKNDNLQQLLIVEVCLQYPIYIVNGSVRVCLEVPFQTKVSRDLYGSYTEIKKLIHILTKLVKNQLLGGIGTFLVDL